jgi:hypothetical protein
VSSDLPSNDSDGDTSIYARSNDLRELGGTASLAAREKQRAISNIDHEQWICVIERTQGAWIYIEERFE